MNNYSNTRCPKCENSLFELAEDAPANSAWKLQYIRCSTCNTFLAALPYNNTNILIEKLQEDIDKIKKTLNIYS